MEFSSKRAESTPNVETAPQTSSRTIEDYRFSFFKPPITNKWPMRTVTPQNLYKLITHPSMKPRTEAVHACVQQYKQAQEAGDREEMKKWEEQVRKEKAKLPYVTFAGDFSYCDSSHLVSYSGLMCFDFDHVGGYSELKALEKELEADPCFETILMFISPTYSGVKWIISVDRGDIPYGTYYRMVQSYLNARGLPHSDSTPDIARACYLPYDPECYINPHPGVRTLEPFDTEYWAGQLFASHRAQNANTERKNPEVKEKKEGTGNAPRMQANIPYGAPRESQYSHLTKEEIVAEVDEWVSTLEQYNLDIACGRSRWIKVAYCLSGTLGQDALPFFLRISALHPKEQRTENPRETFQSCFSYAQSGLHTLIIDDFFRWCENELMREMDIWAEQGITPPFSSFSPVPNDSTSNE